MKHTMKILSVFLAFIMIISIIPMSSITAGAEETATSGTCGDDLTWTYDSSTYTLTISGTGAMYDYDYGNRPWEDYVYDITTVVINDGVTTIGDYAFYSCDNLESVTIPNSVTTIGNWAFYSCDSLTSVTIPDSVTTIGEHAFYYCDSLTSITVDSNNEDYSSDEYGVLFNKDKTTLVQYPIGNTRTSYTIPDSVISIGNYAFSDCTSLTSITIPDSVTTISDSAFRDCTSLTSVTIPNSVTSIGCNAFHYCTSLTNVTIPDSVITIGAYAFKDCTSLTSITIPHSVTSIGVNAFQNCTSLTNITIPDSVTSIGGSAFSGCTGLTSITIPDSVTSIGYYAFYNTAYYNKTSNWENVVLYICNHLIRAKTSISDDYKIKDGTLTIANFAFEDCDSLTNVTIPDSVTTIGDSAFHYCTNLTSVTIGDSVITIGDCAFYSCESLTSVTISDSVTTIGNWAFYDCTSLTDVYYSGTEEQWSTISIGSNNDPLLNATIHFLGEETHKCLYESVVTPPTCTEQGYTTYTCSCGDSYIDNYIEPSHKPKTITIPATCTVAGMEYNVCEICGETIGESTVIPPTGHTAGEWETVLEPTYEADGKKVKKCTVCGDVIAEEVIPMLVKNVITDEETGVSMEFDNTNYNGVVDIVVEESFDGTAFDVIDTSLNASQKFIYDITMTVDGVATQPNGAVTIRIPLPAGYDPNRSFVYHVNTETGTVEKMPATYENGYLVFETTHFSYYAVVEEYNYSFSIQNPSRTEIRNKDGIILHAVVDGTAPSGSYVRWESSNGNFDEDANGYDLEIIAKNKGWTTFTAILCAEDGTELARSSVEMYSKSGFFDKIGGFFRSLFGTTKVYGN